MKTSFKTGLIGLILLSANSPLFAAEETLPVSLKLPDRFAMDACPQKVWQDLKVVWKGVEDVRSHKELGEMNPGSDHPTFLISELPLGQVFEGALKQLFSQCGMTWVAPGNETLPQLSARIEAFDLGVDKKLLTQKGKARSLIKISVEKPGVKTNADVGYEIETKTSRFQTKEKIQKTLNELFSKTLEQIPKNSTLRELK